MSWEEIEVNKTVPMEKMYVSIRKGVKGIRLTFSTNSTTDLKKYGYCKALLDIDNKLIGLQLVNKNDKNNKKLTYNKSTENTGRVVISFTHEWAVAKEKLSLPDIEKSLKYELKKEKDDFFVIDCNKPIE